MVGDLARERLLLMSPLAPVGGNLVLERILLMSSRPLWLQILRWSAPLLISSAAADAPAPVAEDLGAHWADFA